jgi:3-hydroxybutyryl-CoA dehydrogenase
MGPAFAAVFALGGYRVSLTDVEAPVLDTALERADATALGWRGADAARLVRSRVQVESDLLAAAEDAEIVLEAVSEDIETKQRLFAHLDAELAPSTILCSNTSALPISEVMAHVERGARALGTHWFNPPHLVPAVEVIRGPKTSEEVVARVVGILRELGKEPVEVTDTPGFLANRLQMALAKEAMLCLAEGVATADDIDRLFANSIGFRLAAAGPLAIADFAGLDVYEQVLETLAHGVSERFEPPQLLRSHVRRGRLGAKTGGGFLDFGERVSELIALRDQRLLALSRLRDSDEWSSVESNHNGPARRSVLLAANDSVVVVLEDVLAGERVAVPGQDSVSAAHDVPVGHKLAIVDLEVGEVVRKYGEAIGVASDGIRVGDHVHVHNLASTRAGGSDVL